MDDNTVRVRHLCTEIVYSIILYHSYVLRIIDYAQMCRISVTTVMWISCLIKSSSDVFDTLSIQKDPVIENKAHDVK